jgi:hypothetical protein
MNNKLTFALNQKGTDTVLFDKYRYNFSIQNQSGTSRWRCVNRSECSSTITLNTQRTLILRSSPHSCMPEKIDNDVFIAINKCKEEVCRNFGSVENIFEKQVLKLKKKCNHTDIDDIPEFSSKKGSLYEARKKFLETKSLKYKTVADVHIPKKLGKDFVICEDGTINKIILFSSTTARMYLSNAELEDNYVHFFGDGTFQCVPHPFYQLYSLHVDVGSTEKSTNIVPFIFGLLPDKRQETYIRFFSLIKERLSISVLHFKCDFELAVMNAIKQVFPECTISGCFYHYNKAIWRKAKLLNLNTSKEDRKMVKMTSYLPLLPERFIEKTWNSIINAAQITENVSKFIEYYNKQWIPLIKDEILSCAYQRHRTTNPVEGWHHRVNVRFGKKNPPFFRFFSKLKTEAVHQDHRIMKSYFTVPKKNRRNRHIRLDRALKALVEEVDTEKISPIFFLKQVIFHKVAEKNK